MIDYIDLTDWKTKRTILMELGNVTDREWRKYVETYNKQFWSHEVDTFIAHGSNGYKLTSDKQEIADSIKDYKKRALNMLWKYSRTMKALGEADNIAFDLKEIGVI